MKYKVNSKYSINITNENTMEYRIMCYDEDVTNALDNNFVKDLIYEIYKQRADYELLKRGVNSFVTSKPAVMTSPIGDLTIDADGLRKAIDEISMLREKLKYVENTIHFALYTCNKSDEK